MVVSLFAKEKIRRVRSPSFAHHMNKPQLIKVEFYDYHSLLNYINDTYAVDIDHYNSQHSFWDSLLDWFSIGNGDMLTISWRDVKEHLCTQDWEREICDMFIAEFGENPHNIQFP